MSAPDPTAPDDRRLAMALALTAGRHDSGASVDAVRRALDTTAVVVAVDPKDGPAAVLAAAAIVSMAARVVGHVVVGPVALPQPNPWRVRSLRGVAASSRLVSPRVPSQSGARGGTSRPEVTRRITVQVGANGGTGAPGFEGMRADVFAGGDDWTAVVSRRRPMRVGRCVVGGGGLHAAAALAFGEVLKDLLVPYGMRAVPIDDEHVWNLVDGTLQPSPPVRLHPSRPRLPPPQVALLGAGSVGSSAAALLAASGLRGGIDVVDPDRFDPVRNALRCPAVAAAETAGKAAWASRLLADSGWSSRTHVRTVAEWAATRPGPGYRGIAVVSVDDVDGRRDAGDLLAATTLSAGVTGTTLHVQRHQATDDLACPYCDLVDARRWSDRAVTYARLGLSLGRLQALLAGAPLSAEDVTTAVWTGAVDPGAVRDLPGKRLSDLLRRHRATTPDEDEQVPAPHVSWMTGTLLAVEVIKAALGLPALDRRVELDLSGVPLGGWRRPARDPSGRCPCTTVDRRALVRSLYGR